MKKSIIIIIISIFIWNTAKSQQDIGMSQYMFNGLYLNPAYAGSHDYISIALDSRRQWLDFEGSPLTNIFAIDGNISGTNVGLGLVVTNDQLGVTNNTEIQGVYSYHIKLSSKSKLSFGLKAGASNFRENLGELKYWDSDPIIQSDYTSKWFFKTGFGMYYYTKKFFLGLSIPTLLTFTDKEDFSVDINKTSYFDRHYFLYSGYVIPMNDDFDLKPTVMVKYVNGAPMQADFNIAVLYKEKIWLGAGYRTGVCMTALLEVKISHNLRMGYSYDFLNSDIYKYFGGSHEVMLGFDFGGNKRKFKNVRYF